MKKIIIVCIVLLSLGMSADAQNQKVLNLERYAQANKDLVYTTGARVVLFGDSITDNWARMRPGFFVEHGFVGRGISGEVTAQMLLRMRADVIDIQASTMVLLAGINDIAENLGDEYNEDATFSNIQSMVELCWMNGIRPVLCSLLPSYRFFWRPDAKDPLRKLESLNARMKEYCERHGITYVDYHAALVGPDGHRIRTEFAEDTVHPNVAGYEIMEDLLLKALNIK
ncbi:MAG: lipase [Bacteroidales bacterium]|nr:lipase [Bacteroidales bacterium]